MKMKKKNRSHRYNINRPRSEPAKLRALCALPTINTSFTRLYPHQWASYAPLSCLVTNTVVSVGSRAEKFNIVRNNHGHMQRCEFSVLDQKHPFWANLAQKIKIVSLSWNFVPKPIRICRIHWWCSLFLFSTRNTFFG